MQSLPTRPTAKVAVLLLASTLAGPAAEAQTENRQNGLMLHLAFNEAVGDRITDLSGAANHGRVVGNAEYVDAVLGKGFRFDGQTFIRLADGNVLKIDNELTVCFWAKNEDQPWTRYGHVFSFRDMGGYSHRTLSIRWGYDENYLQVLRCNNKSQKRTWR